MSHLVVPGSEYEDTEQLRQLRQARAQDLGRVVPLIMSVRYYEGSRGFNWPHASAALALDRYLAAPLEHELDRAARDPGPSS
ncbi:hypothetical protein [Kribbella sindirgiensis]|uniref:Uncharacterized protein n=1 Tax=Kribbella sindirgiensis TaxID=1124744 RepID=A0A4V2M461_9ACTN|nr:hypothetical protein [Kribbella sindirgiensis]TCC34722.1 hypothetical protein E0H50_12460 [Kribbella sindirgiensis]